MNVVTVELLNSDKPLLLPDPTFVGEEVDLHAFARDCRGKPVVNDDKAKIGYVKRAWVKGDSVFGECVIWGDDTL